MRLLLRRIHLVLSLAAGLWLAASGITGSLLVFGDALEQRMHPSLFVVREEARVSLDAVVAAAEHATGGRMTRMRLAGTNTPVHEVWIDCDECKRVWVDPSTARVNGVRSAHGTTRTFLHELHRRLLVRGAGDVAVLVGAVILLVVTITGITLGWRGGVRMRRRSLYELHRVVGLVVAPVLIIAASTGIYFITASQVWRRPPRPSFDAGRGRPALHLAYRRAVREFPDAEATWVSRGADEVVVRFRQSREVHPNGRTFVRVGETVVVNDALKVAPKQKFLDNLYPLHIGLMGGRAHRLVLFVAGWTPAMLMITGVLLWLRRRARSVRNVRYVPATETFSKTSVGVRSDE